VSAWQQRDGARRRMPQPALALAQAEVQQEQAL